MEGQKVVKVFCHEDKSIEQFKEINNRLRESANNANKVANITMPVNGNIGNISYVLCAIVGGILALSDFSGLTIGTLVAFLSLNKSFTQPVTQISQQVSSIVMAMAGAGRVFELCDEKPEVDEGFVELVNVRYNKNNELIETKENTEMWAWKKPAKDGSSAEYTRLAGDVTFDGVDFGYNPDKWYFTILKCMLHRDRRLHLLEAQVPERLQLLILSTGSMIFRMVRSDMMELTSTILRKMI